jgi:hypothetical protein
MPSSFLQPDTRKVLRTGLWIFGIGVVSVIAIHAFFGGIGRQGPLMLAMGCLPTGSLTLLLAILKIFGDYRRR